LLESINFLPVVHSVGVDPVRIVWNIGVGKRVQGDIAMISWWSA